MERSSSGSGAGSDIGSGGRRGEDVGCALPGKSTLHRLAGSADVRGYKKIVPLMAQMDKRLRSLFIESFATPPTSLVLDIDATDDPLHGHQEGRFFHGDYDNYRARICTSACIARAATSRTGSISRS